MIEVTIYGEKNNITSFTLSGHAESGPKGHDLVCAGVSAVAFGAVNAITSICHLDLQIDQAKDGGYLSVALPKDMLVEQLNNAQILLKGMLISLETIERSYGDYIKIIQV